MIVVVELLGKIIDDDLVWVVCVLELIYIYLLIYDDLLVMDNDDFCCGKLINYWVYGLGVVILVGDGLLIFVFEWVSDNQLKVLVCLWLV